MGIGVKSARHMPEATKQPIVALTDRPFDDWSIEAMKRWPELSDAVVAEVVEGRPH